jgi:hypothetical protein
LIDRNNGDKLLEWRTNNALLWNGIKMPVAFVQCCSKFMGREQWAKDRWR